MASELSNWSALSLIRASIPGFGRCFALKSGGRLLLLVLAENLCISCERVVWWPKDSYYSSHFSCLTQQFPWHPQQLPLGGLSCGEFFPTCVDSVFDLLDLVIIAPGVFMRSGPRGSFGDGLRGCLVYDLDKSCLEHVRVFTMWGFIAFKRQ